MEKDKESRKGETQPRGATGLNIENWLPPASPTGATLTVVVY